MSEAAGKSITQMGTYRLSYKPPTTELLPAGYQHGFSPQSLYTSEIKNK